MRLLTPIAVITLLPPLWFGLLWLFSQTGWGAVARRYPQGDRRPAVRRRFRSLAFVSGLLPCNYNSCVTIGCSRDGLFLRILWPFRAFHPPVFVPWGGIRTTARQAWYGRWVGLTFADVPGVTVRLPAATAVELADGHDEPFGSSPKR